MNNGHHFDDPEWRSPLTGSTKEEILEMRETHMRNFRLVNGQIVAYHARQEADNKLLKEANNKLLKEAT